MGDGYCLEGEESNGYSLRMMFWNVRGWARHGIGAKEKSVDNLDLKCFNLMLLGLQKHG